MTEIIIAFVIILLFLPSVVFAIWEIIWNFQTLHKLNEFKDLDVDSQLALLMTPEEKERIDKLISDKLQDIEKQKGDYE